MNKIEIITIVVVSVSVLIAGTYGIVNAQVPTDKYFYLGTNPVGVLDDFLYPSGDQVSYDISGYPPITIIVHKWSDLSAPQKTQITVRLQTMGYIEGAEVNPSLIGVGQ